jgi:hypothetical protein
LQKRLAGIETDQKRLTWLHFHLDVPIKLTLLQADTYHLPKGTAEVTYQESNSGRIYAINGFMQTACREIRAAAFQGLWDYDFSACHHSLLSQLARRVGIDTPTLDQYLRGKATIRRQIAEEIDVPLAAVKQSMIAMVYGAQRRTSPIPGKKELPAILAAMGSEEKARAFFAHPFVKALYDDLHQIRKPIIDAMPRKRGYAINVLGKGIRETEPPERILAHQLQGAEATCLGAVIQTSGENLTLLMHDGFISRTRLNIDELTDAIFKSTGFLMEIEEAELS